MDKIPTREQLFEPVIDALKMLGGSRSVDEINEAVISSLGIPEHLVEVPRDTKSADGRTKLEYELAWVRTMLKGNGYITNSQRGVWALTNNPALDLDGLTVTQLDVKSYQQEEIDEGWKSILLKVLGERLSSQAFERLIQRILREKGFTQVEVTGRTNDGGIDGKGIAKINGILSFHIVFQCKRYQGSVSASQVRDFRGAMVGRTDKGLLITTGYFTREAIKEANRDGAPAIDLIDGEKLADQLKELNLGVKVDLIERVSIEEDWFETI